MKRAIALTACVLAAGCGGGEAEPEPDLEPAPPGVARDVRAMFRDYSQAMGREDFAAACRHLTDESIEQLAGQVQEADPGVRECPELLGRLYGPPGSDTRDDLGDLVRTLRVDAVDATARRDTVLLSWSAEVDGRRTAIRQPVLRVGRRWQLVAQPSTG